jgi:hypothetical protein
MRGKHHGNMHAAHMAKGGHKAHHHRKSGGKIEVEGLKAGEGGGDPFVEEEAEKKKHGGKTKHHRKHGGHVEGKKPHHRMDRKRGGKVHDHHVEGRKRGGRVGSDTSPLSSAHNGASPSPLPKAQEGGLSK